VLILGGTADRRTNVARRLAQRYGFVLVMARELLAEQIARSTEVGRLVLENVKHKTLVKDSIMNGLVQSRLGQVDAQMQGFVLEGFPRTEGQAVSLKDAVVQPSLVVVL
jgi:adenylate kinase